MFDFENYPRKRLQFGLTRRQLWTNLLHSTNVQVAKAEGGRAFELADLGELPDNRLAIFIPQVIPGTTITANEGFVWGQLANSERVIQLFPLDLPALTAFNAFNGQNTLLDASEILQAQTTWEQDRCFAYVRGLFLSLVVHGICQPGG